MKIQSLAVIFIIIILPVSLVLSSYLQNQITTLNLQTTYDSKLMNATYDAIKAFQLNTINSATSDIATSKIRDIEASASTFYNSIATNFGLKGNSVEAIQDYIPALVYTMYDGYYIYTKYLNDINKPYTVDDGSKLSSESTYQSGVYMDGLKSYVYYSCRYKTNFSDVVISYSLDDYITIQGKVYGESINKSGYLLSHSSSNGLTYNGVSIAGAEQLREYVGNTEYNYVKVNGVKYYQDGSKYFSLINGKKVYTASVSGNPTNNDSAVQYYKKAYEFTNWVRNNIGLKNLTYADAVDANGNHFSNSTTEISGLYGNLKIFDDSTIDFEDENSNFSQHRLAVIRYSIETNLAIAIANYNRYTGTSTNFQMPNLTEIEWNTIITNVSLISFLQGLSIGGKIYNGYAIVPNNKNEEFVSEDSIFIADGNSYYRIADTNVPTSGILGCSNVQFESNYVTDDNGNKLYYYPKKQLGSYTSIVGHSGIAEYEDLYLYIKNLGNANLKSVYYTAIGRERYSMYRANYDIYTK